MLPVCGWLAFLSRPTNSRDYSKWVKSVNFNKHCLGRSNSKVCSVLDDPFCAEDDRFVNVGVAVRSRFKHVFAVCGRDRGFFIGWKMVATVLAVLGRIGPFGSDWVEFRQAGSKFDRQALLWLSELLKTWWNWWELTELSKVFRWQEVRFRTISDVLCWILFNSFSRRSIWFDSF